MQSSCIAQVLRPDSFHETVALGLWALARALFCPRSPERVGPVQHATGIAEGGCDLLFGRFRGVHRRDRWGQDPHQFAAPISARGVAIAQPANYRPTRNRTNRTRTMITI